MLILPGFSLEVHAVKPMKISDMKKYNKNELHLEKIIKGSFFLLNEIYPLDRVKSIKENNTTESKKMLGFLKNLFPQSHYLL
jgi:hypothetical protein